MNSEYWNSLTSQFPTTAPTFWGIVIAAVATVILWHVPGGRYLLYPFSILATWFHEMGHGLTALCLGGKFEELYLYPNGSGMAVYRIPASWGAIRNSLIAAGGPLAPSLLGACFFVLAKKPEVAQWGLYLLVGILILSTLLWVRTLFGWIAIPLWAIALGAVAIYARPEVQSFCLQFLGVQACLSTFYQFNYLFTYQAEVGGKVRLSDTGIISHHLYAPYWFWGILLSAISLAVLGIGLHWSVSK
ncbi:Hypothetical protein PBC10988_7210 [Planctomycetales bacterium 10988]|nr:Hypothetical protein PBC10988_7210 [Planctomycetales bacterium 10988]